MNTADRQRFRELLERQKAAYARMAALVTAQAQALETGDSDVLMPLAEQASALRQEAEGLQVEIDPLRAAWEQSRDAIPADERDLLKCLMEEIRTLLEQMLELMAALKGGVGESRDEKLKRLKDLQRGQAARKGYADLGRMRHPGSRLVDRDG